MEVKKYSEKNKKKRIAKEREHTNFGVRLKKPWDFLKQIMDDIWH